MSRVDLDEIIIELEALSTECLSYELMGRTVRPPTRIMDKRHRLARIISSEASDEHTVFNPPLEINEDVRYCAAWLTEITHEFDQATKTDETIDRAISAIKYLEIRVCRFDEQSHELIPVLKENIATLRTIVLNTSKAPSANQHKITAEHTLLNGSFNQMSLSRNSLLNSTQYLHTPSGGVHTAPSGSSNHMYVNNTNPFIEPDEVLDNQNTNSRVFSNGHSCHIPQPNVSTHSQFIETHNNYPFQSQGNNNQTHSVHFEPHMERSPYPVDSNYTFGLPHPSRIINMSNISQHNSGNLVQQTQDYNRSHFPSNTPVPSHFSTPYQSHNSNYSRGFTQNARVPIYKWDTRFSGESGSMDALDFIQRVKSLARSRNMTELDLFNSAAEFFTDVAAKWFLSQTFANWGDIEAKLISDFVAIDYFDNLIFEIKDRKQKESESIVVYFASFENLCSRLRDPMPEENKIRILKKNVLPKFRPHIALFASDTVAQLKEVCKILEANFPTSSSSKWGHRNVQFDSTNKSSTKGDWRSQSPAQNRSRYDNFKTKKASNSDSDKNKSNDSKQNANPFTKSPDRSRTFSQSPTHRSASQSPHRFNGGSQRDRSKSPGSGNQTGKAQ